jgi:large subunit ribosomal protein L15
MPMQRRLPKRGFHNPFGKEWAIVNIRDLTRFAAGSVVDLESLKAHGLVKKVRQGLKILGTGSISHSLVVRAHHFSLSAKTKIETAGGKAEVI